MEEERNEKEEELSNSRSYYDNSNSNHHRHYTSSIKTFLNEVIKRDDSVYYKRKMDCDRIYSILIEVSEIFKDYIKYKIFFGFLKEQEIECSFSDLLLEGIKLNHLPTKTWKPLAYLGFKRPFSQILNELIHNGYNVEVKSYRHNFVSISDEIIITWKNIQVPTPLLDNKIRDFMEDEKQKSKKRRTYDD